MKTIINNINYKVDIYDNTVLINSLFDKLHELKKEVSNTESLTDRIDDVDYRLDEVEYKTEDVLSDDDIFDLIDTNYLKEMLLDATITEDIQEMVFDALGSEYAKAIINKISEKSTTDDAVSTPAQRLTNNILNYYGGDWNADDFDNCFEIVNKYNIKLKCAKKKAVKGGK